MTHQHDPSAPLAPGAGGHRPPTRGFAHAGVTVRDMERSLAFYVEGLGLECVSRRPVEAAYIRRIVDVLDATSIEVAMLAFPGGEIVVELLAYAGCEREDGSARPCDPGSGHFCLFVDDVHAVWRNALAAGGTPRSPEPIAIESGPYEGGFGCYLTDPDGYSIELLQAPRKDHT
jgi:lactoylglutathione lyase